MTPAVRRALAWGVHFYTGLGLACAAGMAVLIVEGEPGSYRLAFALMLLATLIDATDGTLARAVKVKEALPNFDGRRLDDLIDFLTYVALPLLLVWRARLLPDGTDAALLLPLFAAGYGFSQVEAKTEDGYFLGFPSYWNVVAFYLYALRPLPGWVSLALVIVPALLTFVPSRYLYPSQKGRLNLWTNVLAGPWVGLLALSLYRMTSDDEASRWLALVSLYFPAYYLAASWWVSVRHWLRAE
jgi:phosphatidylcholine synthase